MIKEKYKQWCLYRQFGGIRTIGYTQSLHASLPKALHIIENVTKEELKEREYKLLELTGVFCAQKLDDECFQLLGKLI